MTPDRARKSIGVERTFERDLTTAAALSAELPPLADAVAARLEEAGVYAGNVIVKLRTASFELLTRRERLLEPTADARVLEQVAARILGARFGPPRAVRLLGVQTDQLVSAEGGRRGPVPLFGRV